MKHLGITHQRGESTYDYAFESRCMLGQLEARMRTTGQKFGSWSRDLEDGTRIVVSIIANGPAPIYRAFVVPVVEDAVVVVPVYDFFLESGAYKVQVFDNVYSGQYIVGARIEAQYAPLIDWNGDGSVTQSDIVCPLQTIPLPVNSADWPPAPFIGSLDPRGYVTTGSQRGTNQNAWMSISRVQASVFPGKMALYVQSLYGSDRTDLTYYYSGGTGSWPQLIVSNHTLGFRGNSSRILLTTSDYRYFLCNLPSGFNASSIDLTVRELVPYLSEGHAKYNELMSSINGFRGILTTKYSPYYNQPVTLVPTECSITEAALLSLLAPSDTVYQTVSVVVPDDEGIIYGTPLAYGWDAKWGGEEASIVSLTPDTLAFNTATRRLTLSITYNADVDGNPVFSGLLATTPVQAMHLYNDLYVWEPNGWSYSDFYLSVNFYMCGISEPNDIVPSGNDYYSDFEFYGWYDDDDVWISCSLERINLGDTSEPASDYVKPYFCSYGVDTQDSMEDISDTIEVQRNIKIGGHNVLSVTQPGQNYSTTRAEISAGNIESDFIKTGHDVTSGNRCFQTPEDFFPEYNPFQTYCWDVDWGTYDWERDRLQASALTGRTSVVVPFGTRKGLLYGTWHYTNSGYKYTDTQATLIGIEQNQQYPFELQAIKRHGDPCPPCCQEGLWSGANFNQKSSNYSSGQWTTDITSDSTGVSDSYSVRWFAAQGTDIGIAIYDESTGAIGDQSILAQHADNMALVGANPPGADNPDFSGEMNAFFEPANPCFDRTLGVSANILRSAVFHSIDTYSNSSAMTNSLKALETSDGYATEDTGFSYFDSFVGWA